MDAIASLIVVAAEQIAPDSVMAKLVFPLGLLVFLGTTYLLLRSNLGTRRGYLVLGTCVFAFLSIWSLFWAFGAPGTPQATGPKNLPGQAPDALQPKWVPFAQDSLLAEREDLRIARDFPQGFEQGSPEDFPADVQEGIDETAGFFSSSDAGKQIEEEWEPQTVGRAEAPGTGVQVIGVEFRDPEQGETYLAFAYFDEGSLLLPSFLFIGASLLGLLVHGFLLDRDEQRQRQRAAAGAGPPRREKVPAGA